MQEVKDAIKNLNKAIDGLVPVIREFELNQLKDVKLDDTTLESIVKLQKHFNWSMDNLIYPFFQGVIKGISDHQSDFS